MKKLEKLISDRLEVKKTKDIERAKRKKIRHIEYDENDIIIYSYFRQGKKRYAYVIYADSKRKDVVYEMNDFPSFQAAKDAMDYRLKFEIWRRLHALA